MTDRNPDRLSPRLVREHGALRAALVARHALRGLAVCAAALALAFAAGMAWPAGVTGAWVRLALLATAGIAALAGAVRALRRDVPAYDTWLESLETSFPQLRSRLRNALDFERDPAAGAGDLAAALRADAAARLGGVRLAAVRPPVRPRVPLAATAGAMAALALLTAFAPGAARRSWTTLWNPALAAPPVTLAVEPGSVEVAPGATLAVRARVRGTSATPRLVGEGAAPAPQLESSEGGVRRWRFDLPPVTRARDYAVRVASARSPNYRITLSGRPQPVSFAFEYRAPAYARLPVQSGASTSGDLAALRGSETSVEVTFDRDLESLRARLPGGQSAEWSAITPRRWRGRVNVREDGEWNLHAVAATGAGDSRWRVSALADAPPVLTVVEPHGDIDLPSGSQVPFDVIAEDDLGLTRLGLEWRKDAAQPWRGVPLAAFAGEPREARVAAAWDASALALLPGETGTFRFVVLDNDRVAGPARATSAEFRLRFPSLSELYRDIDQRQQGVQQTLQQAADQAHELQKSLDQLERRAPRAGAPSPPQYERREELRKAAERQGEIARRLDDAARETRRTLADAAERQAFHEDLQQKLREMAELVRQIQSPEFKDALKRMQEALDKMDANRAEQSLAQMREQNQDMLKNLERSLALLKRMRDEERMDALAKRADELKQRQDAMNDEHRALADRNAAPKDGRTPEQRRADIAERERAAADETKRLAEDARAAAKDTQSPDAREDLQAAAGQLEQQAAAEQRDAAEQSERGQSRQAEESGRQASESLAQAGARMNQGTQSSQQARDAKQLAAVKRSTQDLVSLGRDAQQSMQQGGSNAEQADRQTDLAEGVARVADSLAALGKETPVLSPRVQQALGRAMSGMQQSGRELAQGNSARARQSSQGAGAALGEAVRELRVAQSSMCDKPGANPGGKQPNGKPGPGQRMSAAGDEQGSLNGRSKQLASRLSQAQRLTPGDRAELRRLADEQARIRSELEDIQRDDAEKHQLLGRLDQVRKDMQQVEEQLRSGEITPDLEERQNRILSRMLDAQRSINRRDFDPDREAQRAGDAQAPSPAPLPASLLREDDRLRLGLMKADADRYPAQYRAFIERYLQRLNGSSK